MSKVSRRDFLAGASAVAGAAGLAGRFALAADLPARPKKGTDLVTLGRTGLKATVLGLGTGTRGGSEQRTIGQNEFVRVFRHAYERGVRYIDTADAYQTHLFVRYGLEGLPREDLFILSKTRAKNAEVAKFDIDRLRRELDVKYLDCLLMHCMTKAGWVADMRPVMDVLYEAKQKEVIRSVGISVHGMPPLVDSVDVDWIDIQLARINGPVSRMSATEAKMDGPHEEVVPLLKKMHDKGRGVLGMKIFGEGAFTAREERLQSIKYVMGLGSVDAFTIGMTSVAQVDENLDLIQEALA